MIAFLQGTVRALRSGFAVVENNGIGYKVSVTSYTLGKLASMKHVALFVHTYVREDTLALYGFLQENELAMFELLISVSGIGPKAALSILSIADPKTITTAILNDDASILTRVSGVGKKTAERVILELQNKVADISVGDKEQVVQDTDALEALTAMGYSASEAREALKQVPSTVTDLSEKVKQAFKYLGKQS